MGPWASAKQGYPKNKKKILTQFDIWYIILKKSNESSILGLVDNLKFGIIYLWIEWDEGEQVPYSCQCSGPRDALTGPEDFKPSQPSKGKERWLLSSVNSLALSEALKWLLSHGQTLTMEHTYPPPGISPIPLGMAFLPGTWPLKGHSPISRLPGSGSNLSADLSKENENSQAFHFYFSVAKTKHLGISRAHTAWWPRYI